MRRCPVVPSLVLATLTACAAPQADSQLPANLAPTEVTGSKAAPLQVAASADPRLPELYRCWFSGPYPYMFANADPDRGQFRAGIRGIVFYGGLARCMGKMVDGRENRVVGDHTPIERFSDLEVLIRDGAFRAFNPAIIRWGHENLIPPPDTVIDDRTAREHYHDQFARFFRLMAEAYLDVQPSFGEEQALYQSAVDDGKDGLDYLEARFAGRLRHHEHGADGTAMTVPMAYGFWLRRGLDATEGELWIGLRKVLLLYDADWYAGLESTYPDAGVAW